MKCPSCLATTLVLDTRDISYTYKSQSTALMDIPSHYCHNCGESVHDEAQTLLLQQAKEQFAREVEASTVAPGFIASVRAKLSLDQHQAAEILGSDVGDFVRYEDGTAKPSLATVQLLKLLNRHPELLNEVQLA